MPTNLTVAYKLSDYEKASLLEIIRKSVLKKHQYTPRHMSKEDFQFLSVNNPNLHLCKGLISIWNTLQYEDENIIVVQKQGGRDSGSQFLLFDSFSQYKSYSDACHSLGISIYSLVEEWLNPKLIKTVKANNLPKMAYEEIQLLIEYSVGIHYDIREHNISDDALYAKIVSYINKTVLHKLQRVLSENDGKFIYADQYGFEIFGADNSDDYESVFSSDINLDDIDYSALVSDVVEIIESLFSKKGNVKKYDIKDNLLPVIISSKSSLLMFLQEYYTAITNRVAIWRPLTLGYQITYSYENGINYLKNPSFITECGNSTLGEIINSQAALSVDNKRLLLCLDDIHIILNNNNQYNLKIIECADSPGQIGKALSKELRTKEAIIALSKSLPFAAAEKNPDIKIRFLSNEGVSQNE